MLNKVVKIMLVAVSFVGVYFAFLKVEIIRSGGPLMIPILLCSVFSLAIIFSKMLQFSRSAIDVESFLKRIFECIERQRIKEAIDMCNQSFSPVARVLRAGIVKYDRPKDEIKEAMQDSFLYENPVLEGNLFVLSTIVQITPLLGFLGTLTGMMKVLYMIQIKNSASLAVTLADMAPGIWQALVCSASGLIVVIPLFIAHNYLIDKVKYFVEEMERASTELLNFLMDRRMPL